MADTDTTSGEAKMEEYFVSEACIACDACCDDFPDIFTMNADHTRAQAVAASPVGKFNPWDIVTVCPVDAISLIKGEMPPPPEGMEAAEEELAPVELEDNRPWEVRWAEVRDQSEPEWERMKRYGLAYTIDETPDKIYVRFAMPALVPNHKFKFKWGLPNKMPDYKIDINLEGRRLKVKAVLEDKRVKKLCDVGLSFPDRFLREFDLPAEGSSFTQNYDAANKQLDIAIDKAVATAQAA